MIEAFRESCGKLVLHVSADSAFEATLLEGARRHGIRLAKKNLKKPDVSRYLLSHPEENRFGHHFSVVFRRWPRQQHLRRVRVELRRMDGRHFTCQSESHQVLVMAP
jgi:hypothetical protein